MATATRAGTTTLGRTIAAHVASDGTRAAAHAVMLCGPAVAQRDLSDAIHSLCAIHGAVPALVDIVRDADVAPGARDWLDHAAHAIAIERAGLAALTAAVGPIPSTPAHAESEAAMIAQRHALMMLAGSSRAGCGLGAALGLLLDWQAIRRVMNAAAIRAGIVLPASALPDDDTADMLIVAVRPTAGVERAMMFGVEQLLAQHRGLWQLLDARASARDVG